MQAKETGPGTQSQYVYAAVGHCPHKWHATETEVSVRSLDKEFAESGCHHMVLRPGFSLHRASASPSGLLLGVGAGDRHPGLARSNAGISDRRRSSPAFDC